MPRCAPLATPLPLLLISFLLDVYPFLPLTFIFSYFFKHTFFVYIQDKGVDHWIEIKIYNSAEDIYSYMF